MCGIVGFIDPEERVRDADEVLTRMRLALRHRGPDQEGEVHRGQAHFGHQRLAIVDPSEASRQPFCVDELIVVANGEIYNHEELRHELKASGPTNIPKSDCAVIPWLWKDRGDRLAHDLVGMFAIALWDEKQETLFLARDRAGQKPLYVADLPGGGIAFASEVKALLQHPHVSRTLCPMAVRQFLAFDYVPGDLSIYQSIKKLRPGSTLVWRKGNRVEDRFFSPRSESDRITGIQEGADELWQALTGAVQRRLMSDVPLGVFLSGGVDSAAIVTAMSEAIGPDAISTFSVGFDDPRFDESHIATRIAQRLGTHHHVKRLSSGDVMKALPEIMGTLDEPFADASYIPTYLLSRFAAEKVKVALGGDGGDELLLGYPTFYAERQVRLAKLMPKIARLKILLPLITALSKSDGYMPTEFKWRRFLRGLDLDEKRRHVAWIGGVDARDHQKLLTPDFALGGQDIFSVLDSEASLFRANNPQAHSLELLGHQYFTTYLAEGVLQKVDRASMAHSLEVRSPFLDPAVMDVAARCSMDLKLQGKTSKRVLRHALRGRIDEDILNLPKRGFTLPVGQWLRGELQPWMEQILNSSAIKQGGIFDPAAVQALMKEHQAGKVSRHKELWSLLSFETWRRGPHGPDY
jgi:asparagine synthase (glutamine-hydrolysing)